MVAIDAPAFVDGLGEPSIRPFSSEDHAWAIGLLAQTGGRYRVRRGRVVDPVGMPGLVGERGGRSNTLVTISRLGGNLQLVSIASDPFDEELVHMTIQAALHYRDPQCRRAFAICSNAHFDVQRALQSAGFRLCATRPGAIEALARRSLEPLVGEHDGLAVRDEVEFDLLFP